MARDSQRYFIPRARVIQATPGEEPKRISTWWSESVAVEPEGDWITVPFRVNLEDEFKKLYHADIRERMHGVWVLVQTERRAEFSGYSFHLSRDKNLTGSNLPKIDAWKTRKRTAAGVAEEIEQHLSVLPKTERTRIGQAELAERATLLCSELGDLDRT